MLTELVGAVSEVAARNGMNLWQQVDIAYRARRAERENRDACWRVLSRINDIYRQRGVLREAIEGNGGWQYPWVTDPKGRMWRLGYYAQQAGDGEEMGYQVTRVSGNGEKPLEVFLGPDKRYAPGVEDPEALAELINPGGYLLPPSKLFDRLPAFREEQNFRAPGLLQELATLLEKQKSS